MKYPNSADACAWFLRLFVAWCGASSDCPRSFLPHVAWYVSEFDVFSQRKYFIEIAKEERRIKRKKVFAQHMLRRHFDHSTPWLMGRPPKEPNLGVLLGSLHYQRGMGTILADRLERNSSRIMAHLRPKHHGYVESALSISKKYWWPVLCLMMWLSLSALLGAVLGASASHGAVVATWALKDFDATLGFPGEGPAAPGTPVGAERMRRHSRSPRGNLRSVSSPPDVRMDGNQTSEPLADNRSVAALVDNIQGLNLDQPLADNMSVAALADNIQGLNLDQVMEASSSRGSRWYCPVPCCPKHDCIRSAGWASLAAMRPHLAEHASGRLEGDIPQSFMEAQRLTRCTVCSKILSTRFGNACPRCRPELIAASRPASDGRPIPPSYPTLDEVFQMRLPCKSYVPKGAKKLWAQCLVGAIAQVVTHNDIRAWIELFMLPKCVLRASPRGGKRHRKRLDAQTKDLCRSWIEGQRAELWQKPSGRQTGQVEKPSQRQRNDRATAMVQENLFSKACSALTNEPPAEVTREVVNEMRSKHPTARAEDRVRMSTLRHVSSAAAGQVDEDLVKKAIKDFPRGSSGGPSGLKPQHLKDALVAGWADEVARQATSLTNLLARGQAPLAVQQWLCGASLAALPKKTGGLRPVAVGDTWRRLTAKCLMSVYGNDLREFLEPIQVGVGTKGGCEATVHTVRQWLCRNAVHKNKVLVTMDLSNAFNCIDRSAVLDSIRRVTPELAPWVDFCYAHDSNLLLGSEKLVSARGVQQGDPLGPALFAVAIQSAIAAAKRQVLDELPGELDWTVFYLDDGVVAGTDAAVARLCDLLKTAFADIGLDLTYPKCEAIPAAGCNHDVRRTLFKDFVWIEDGNFKLLGSPFGSPEFCCEHTQKRKRKAELLLQAIRGMEDCQSALLLIRHCASFCKLAYSARTVPPELHRSVLAGFSADLRLALEDLLGDQLPDRCWDLAQFGIKHSGVSLRDGAKHAEAAFLASVAKARPLCGVIDSAFDPRDSCGGLLLDQSINTFKGKIAESAHVSLDDSVSQKHLSSLIDAAAKQKLLQDERVDCSFRAHVALTSLPGAGAWLIAPPADDDRKIDSPLFQIALKRRLRAPIFQHDGFCPSCGDCMDRFADHALTCACKGDRTIRHNEIRNRYAVDATDAGLRPEKEKAGLLPCRPMEDGIRIDGGDRRPADIWLPRGASGKGEALDFACTSGLQQGIVANVADDPNFVFERYDSFKRSYKDTDSACAQLNFKFVPMILEAHSGSWSPEARATIGHMAKLQASTRCEDEEMASLRIAQRLSTALHRENARAILKRSIDPTVPSVSPGGWTDYTEDLV